MFNRLKRLYLNLAAPEKFRSYFWLGVGLFLLILAFLVGCSEDRRVFDSNDPNDSLFPVLPCFEDRDTNHPLLTFISNGREVALDIDPNGYLYIKRTDCNEAEAAEVVWEATDAVLKRLNSFGDYMKRLADAY